MEKRRSGEGEVIEGEGEGLSEGGLWVRLNYRLRLSAFGEEQRTKPSTPSFPFLSLPFLPFTFTPDSKHSSFLRPSLNLERIQESLSAFNHTL